MKCLIKKPLNNYLIISLFIVIGFVLYLNSFSNQMFWDDDDFILKNQYLKDWQYFPKCFSKNVIAGAGLLSNYWRPVLLSAFSLEWHLWQDWAAGYHFVNTCFHILDAILLFFILFQIFKKRTLAFLTALIFLAHPLQTEAVTYVNSLGDSLSTFFIFLGIIFFLKFRISGKNCLKSWQYFLSLLMYVLALMSKETAFVMPAFVFIADFFLLDQISGKHSLKERLKLTGRAIWPFLLLALTYLILRATVLNFINSFNLYDGGGDFVAPNFQTRFFTFFRVLTVYFGLLFWPFGLHMERSVAMATSLFSPTVILGGLFFLGFLALAFREFKRYPILSFGILWFFIGLAPTSNLIIPINSFIYEHWLYLPLIGIFLVFIWLGMLTAKKYQLERILLAVFILVLSFFSFLTIKRNKDWRNPIILFNQTLKYAPNSYRIVNNLGMAYADKGNYTKAKQLYERAINLDSTNPVAYHNLGNLYRAIKKDDLAVKNYQTAIALDPEFFFSYNTLFDFYQKRGDYKKARLVFEDYLKFNKPSLDILILLAQTAIHENDYEGALGYLKKALILAPKNQLIQTAVSQLEKKK